MSLPKAVADFLNREVWQLVRTSSIGMTADVLILEKEDARCALKVLRDEKAGPGALKTEHQMLEFLNATPMEQYVPGVGEWLGEINGFLMECLRYPEPAEKETAAWRSDLARAIRILHDIKLPSIKEIADDRPEVNMAVVDSFRSIFQLVLQNGDYWRHLLSEDKLKLETVRAHYDAYAGLLPRIENSPLLGKPALTHGDLAGDNIMQTQDGRLAIIDWGAARISSPLTDIASLTMYAGWSEDKSRQFLNVYFNDDLEALEEALPLFDVLSRLYRYRSCLQSLIWINELGDEGLDAIGRAHFEKILNAL